MKVLSIDGGGIKGLIPAMILADLERRAGKPCREIFGLIAGNSTGGIIACGLAAGVAASDLVALYSQRGAKIFSGEDILHGAVRPRYSAEPLEAELAAVLGDAWLSEVGPLLVPAQCLSPRLRTWVFSSDAAKASQDLDFRLRYVARATSAAETYFPSAHIISRTGGSYYMADGGTWMNNPGAMAWAAARRIWPGEKIEVLSLGCGSTQTRAVDGPASQGWGAAEWLTAGGLIDICLAGTADGTERILDLLDADRARIQPPLPPGIGGMDDTSQVNLANLCAVANQTIANQQTAAWLDRFAGVQA